MVHLRHCLWLLGCMSAQNSLAQVTDADLPPCSLKCWDDRPPSNSSSSFCQFNHGKDFEATYSPCFYDHCTTENVLTALNVTSIICNVPDRDISLGMRIFVIVATIVSSAAIGSRVILKYRSLAGEIGWDDWNIVIAVIVVMDAAVGQYLAAQFGLGRDIWKISPENRTKVFQCFYASTVGYKLGNMFTRMSVLCFYLRLFGTDARFRYTTYALIGVNICIGVVFVFLDVLRCRPVSLVWTDWRDGSQDNCMSLSFITWSHSILNIVLDIFTLAMAVWMIKGLNMNLRKKLAFVGMFVIGSAITLVTFLRLQALPPLANTRNRTWGLAPLAYWSAIEIVAGLVLACLPALKKLKYIFSSKNNIADISSSAGNNPRSNHSAGLHASRSDVRGLHLQEHSRDISKRNSKSYITISDSQVDINSDSNQLVDTLRFANHGRFV